MPKDPPSLHPNRAEMLDQLGSKFLSSKMLYKYWPAVGTAFSHIHAMVELLREHPIAVSDVAEIRPYVGDFHQRMCQPIDVRRAPKSLIDAKFSLPFLLALTMVKGSPRVGDIVTSALADPDILQLAAKVTPVSDSAYNWTAELPAAKVEIITRDGRRFERLGTQPPGSQERPMTWEQLASKFSDCALAAARPISEIKVEEAVSLVRSLETCPDVTTLMRLVG